MKNYFTILLLAIFGFLAVSCTDRDDNDTYPMMRDITGTFNSGNSYTISQGINIASTDVVLVYRNINSGSSGSAVWQLIPKTEYLTGGRELDYNFLFDTANIEMRDMACNSDHCPFDKKNVPAIFIYTKGGKTYYHNRKDTIETLTFSGYLNLFTLLTELINN